jgi:dipeptidyl-peptidase-3
MKQIKYFAVNEEIENQIKSIRRAIYLSMNGICAENIDNSGLEYKQNFGVAWSRIVEIAQNYTPDYTLAYRLWLLPIRETKLLATLLCPPHELTAERLAEWIDGISTIELAEIFAFALLRKTTQTEQILKLEQSENHLLRLTAYHTLARQTANLNTEHLKLAIEHINPQDLDEISAFRAIENLITNITFRTSDLNHIINNKLEEIKTHPTTYSNQLIENLKFEI